MKINPSLSIFLSEFVLSLYPQLIKTVPTTLYTQIFSRFLIFTLAALIAGPFKDFVRAWNSVGAVTDTVTYSILNLLHVGSSYYSFQSLPAGTAMSLFYLYPVFNVIAGQFLFGEQITPGVFTSIILAFVGSVLIATSTYTTSTDDNTTDINKKEKTYDIYSILAAIVAALTETLIYIIVKQDVLPSPYYTISSLYSGGVIILLMYLFYKTYISPPQEGYENKTESNKVSIQLFDTKIKTWIPLILFNVFIGFAGYALRFYAIPFTSVAVFSLLSFVGVIASYIFGIIFQGDIPSMKGIIGALLISSAASFIEFSGKK